MGPDIGDEDVGGLDETVDELLAFGLAEVDAGAAFAAVHHFRHVVEGWGLGSPAFLQVESTDGVSAVEGLDLDDVGATLGEEHTGGRPCEPDA